MKLLTAAFTLSSLASMAQFDPAAGQTGSFAIHKDSSAIVAWASGCTVNRGYQNIADQSLGLASAGETSMAIGASDAGLVSLGDGGSAILTFDKPIVNDAGYDFAVFENGFSDDFLELAFVEVSSDGVNYFRFPATSNTSAGTQVGSFGSLSATDINNLAGKYRAGYGTPFDLEELKNEVGLDVNSITHVKVTDVVGCIQSAYATYDHNNNIVNDPWPTPYASSGFDLEAVAVLHSKPDAVIQHDVQAISVYPNPVSDVLAINIDASNQFLLAVFDNRGRLCGEYNFNGALNLDVSQYDAGLYFIRMTSINKVYVGKFTKM